MASKLGQRISELLKILGFTAPSKWFVLGIIVGIGAGLGAIFFSFLLELSHKFFLVGLAGYEAPRPAGEAERTILSYVVHHRLWLFLAPAIGGLFSGFLVYTFAPEAEGHGTDAVIESYHRLRGHIRPQVPLIKAVASALTIGSGGSAGREGPIAQIGAGIGSLLARWMRLSDRERRILVMSGAGAGIGAIFRAPLGGALFGAEVLYHSADIESEGLVPSIIAAVTAYALFGFFRGWNPIFKTLHYSFDVKQLLLFSILGVFVVPFSFAYVKTFYGLRDLFRRINLKPHYKPAIGGILTGVILYFFPYVGGTSYGWVQLALLGSLSGVLMLAIALLKILATSLTIGSGGSGGVFAPSVVIGSMVGGFLGQVFHNLFPEMVPNPTAFALVGMASFFASAAKVPLSTLIMVAEMTGNYDLLVPLTLSSTIAFLLSGRWSIYEKQEESRLTSPAHRGEFIVDILEDIRVRDAVRLPKRILTFREDTPVWIALKKAASERGNCFPVVDRNGRFRGVLYTDDLRAVVLGGELEDMKDLLIVVDAVRDKVPTLKPDDNLAKALSLFVETELDELPILDEKGERCLGTFSREELIKAYDREMLKRRVYHSSL